MESQSDTIKLEVALREPLLLDTVNGSVRTILRDPISINSLIAPVAINRILRLEAFAEKFRAALARRQVAVRDFFDLDYTVQKLGIKPETPDTIGFVRQKLAIPGNDPVNISAMRLATLRQQVEPQLRPVLRAADFSGFDVERAFNIVASMSASLQK